jgi:hypothetical protein
MVGWMEGWTRWRMEDGRWRMEDRGWRVVEADREA